MIISHQYQFIFIKTIKTAGTSIETYLSPLCDAQDILTPFGIAEIGHEPRSDRDRFNTWPEIALTRGRGLSQSLQDYVNQRRFYNHIPAYLVQARIDPAIWSFYFKFCVDRNPWDKTLSYYFFALKRFGEQFSLDQYLEQGFQPINYPQYTDYLNPNRIIVDRVIRYETLYPELDEVFRHLGIPFHGSLEIYAKGNYRCDRRPYSEILNHQQKERIREIYHQEISLLGYEY